MEYFIHLLLILNTMYEVIGIFLVDLVRVFDGEINFVDKFYRN